MTRKKRCVLLSTLVIFVVALVSVYLTSDRFRYKSLASLISQVEHREYIKDVLFRLSNTPTTSLTVTLISDLTLDEIELVGYELMDRLDSHLYYGQDESLLGKVNVGDIVMRVSSKSAQNIETALFCARRVLLDEQITPISFQWIVRHYSTGDRMASDGELRVVPYVHPIPEDWLT